MIRAKIFNCYAGLRRTQSRLTHLSKFRTDYEKNRLNIDWTGWTSASKIYNYNIGDACSDVINPPKCYKRFKGYNYNYTNTYLANSNYKKTTNTMKYLFSKGYEFEALVFNDLITKFGDDCVVDLNGSHKNCMGSTSFAKFDQTVDEMAKGTPIILSAVVHNYKKKYTGVTDIIVRSDYLSKIFTNCDYTSNHPCNFSKDWHYVVIDVKFTTLPLFSDGIYLKTSDDKKYKQYEMQVYMYTECIANIQGYNPKVGFLLGRTQKYTKNSMTVFGQSCYDRPAIIKYKGKMTIFTKRLKQGLHWIDFLKKQSHEFRTPNGDIDVSSMFKYKIFPNMKIINKNPFIQQVKKMFALKTSEITLLPYCGIKQRDNAHQNGIFGFNDPKFVSGLVGIKGLRGQIVDNCVKVHPHTSNSSSSTSSSSSSSESEKIVFNATTVEPNFHNFNEIDSSSLLWIDVESCNTSLNIDNFPHKSGVDIVYMITIGNVNKHGVFKNFTFISNGISKNSEREMFERVIYTIKNIMKKRLEKVIMVHWSNCDKRMWTMMEERHNIFVEPMAWFDACKAMNNHAFGIRNSMSYSLKSVTNALNTHFPSKVTLRFNKGDNGFEASIKAQKVNNMNMFEFKTHPDITEIEVYNQKDVSAMYEIVLFLTQFVNSRIVVNERQN